MKTRPVLWTLALAAAVVLGGCNKHDNSANNDTMQPGANTAPAATVATPAAPAPGMAPASTAPTTSSSAMMPPPTAPATSASSGH
jgi:ABC-type uncharacterized transport system auxiliary subunit